MTVQNAVTGGGTPSSILPDEKCKAWVFFDGTAATPAPLGSYNVASITDNGTGDYAINFDAPMGSANYAAIGYAGSKAAAAASSDRNFGKIGTTADQTASVFSFTTSADTGAGTAAKFDAGVIALAVFGG